MADEENVATRQGTDDGERGRQGVSMEEWTRSFDEWSQSVPDWRQINRWIRENPEASMLGAAGAGVIAGSLYFSRTRPVPTFSERFQATAYEVADEVRDRTGETGRNVSRAVSQQAERASKEASDATRSARKYGEEAISTIRQRARENPELTRMVANALYAGAAAVLVKKLNRWVEE